MNIGSSGLMIDSASYAARQVEALGRIGSCLSDELATPRKLQGGDIVPISGSPRRTPPEHVVAAAQAALRETGYAPVRGTASLRRAIGQRVLDVTSVPIDSDSQVVVTNGAMQALHIILTALLNPDDEVIIPSPCFSYDGLVKLARGRPIYVPMRAEENFAWDMDRIDAAVGPRTKLLVVNTPVNPSGRVLTHEELVRLVDIAQRHDLLILADEAYDRLVFDGRKHESIYGVNGAAERTLLVQSATKTFAMGGWRVGWIVASPSFSAMFAKLVEWMMLASNHVAQAAVAAAIVGPQQWLEDLPLEFQVNRDRAVDALRNIEKLSFVVPQGGPFMLPDISALGFSGDEFAHLLIAEHGLRVTGGSFYDTPSRIRIPLGGTPEAIDETFRRLGQAVREQARRR